MTAVLTDAPRPGDVDRVECVDTAVIGRCWYECDRLLDHTGDHWDDTHRASWRIEEDPTDA